MTVTVTSPSRGASHWIRAAFALAIAFLVAAACGGPSSSGGNSNTNWLHACAADAECGRGTLRCLCGRCTEECEVVSECTHLSRRAVCGAGTLLEPTCTVPSVCVLPGSPEEDASTRMDGATEAAPTTPPDPAPEAGIPDAAGDAPRHDAGRRDAGADGAPPPPDFEDEPVVGADTVYGCAPIRHRRGATFTIARDVFSKVPSVVAGAGIDARVSASGAVVVTTAVEGVGARTFLWTEEAIVAMPVPDGTPLLTPNCDASVLVGGAGGRAVKWSLADGLVILPPADDAQLTAEYRATALAVDAAGTTILGIRQTIPVPGLGSSLDVATRWSGSARAVETDFGSGNSYALAMSADGRVVAGVNTANVPAITPSSAFLVWSETAPLTRAETSSATLVPTCMTADGTAIFGGGGLGGFVWTRDGGFGRVDGFYKVVAATSTGKVLAGMRSDRVAVVWDATHGARWFTDVLAEHGAPVPARWTYLTITGMSEDARIFVGMADDKEVFRVALPADAFN